MSAASSQGLFLAEALVSSPDNKRSPGELQYDRLDRLTLGEFRGSSPTITTLNYSRKKEVFPINIFSFHFFLLICVMTEKKAITIIPFPCNLSTKLSHFGFVIQHIIHSRNDPCRKPRLPKRTSSIN